MPFDGALHILRRGAEAKAAATAICGSAPALKSWCLGLGSENSGLATLLFKGNHLIQHSHSVEIREDGCEVEQPVRMVG